MENQHKTLGFPCLLIAKVLRPKTISKKKLLFKKNFIFYKKYRHLAEGLLSKKNEIQKKLPIYQ